MMSKRVCGRGFKIKPNPTSFKVKQSQKLGAAKHHGPEKVWQLGEYMCTGKKCCNYQLYGVV